MLLLEVLMRNNDKCFVSERIIMFSNITELAIIVSVSGINHQKAEMHTRTATAPHVQARCSDRHQHSGAGRGGRGAVPAARHSQPLTHPTGFQIQTCKKQCFTGFGTKCTGDAYMKNIDAYILCYLLLLLILLKNTPTRKHFHIVSDKYKYTIQRLL